MGRASSQGPSNPAVLSFSVVINTLNRADYLHIALTGLAQQRHSCFEVIVIDGPSTDATAEVLTQFPQVRIGRCSEANLSMSRNIGLAMARGDIVAFLDDDAIPEPNWLQGLQAGYLTPDIAGVGGFIRDRTGLAYQAKVTVCDRFGDCCAFETLEAAKDLLNSGAGWFLSPTGANVSYRRKALLEIGGFDETFTYFLDETDVNLRLWDAGWRLTFRDDADVHHSLAESAQRDHRNVPHSLFAPCRSKAYFALRHASAGRRHSDVLEQLAEHGLILRGHNRALAENGVIDAEHQRRLDRDIEHGLQEGVVCAQRSAPSSPNRTTSAGYDGSPFKPYQRIHARQGLKIAFISQQYPPGVVGGIGVWTHSAARALAARGHEVSVVTLADADAAPSLSLEDGVWVHRIYPRHDAAWLDKCMADLPLPDLPAAICEHAYAVQEALSQLKAQRGLDIVSWPIWDLEGLAAQLAGDVTTMVSLHTTYALAEPYKPDWRDPNYRRTHVDKIITAERTLLAEAPFILANSEQGLCDIEVSSGVDLHRPGVWTVGHGLADRSGRPSRRPDGKVQILFVGRLEPRKGVDILFDALSLILPSNPDTTVRLVGEVLADKAGVTLPAVFAQRFGAMPWAARVAFDGAVSAQVLDQAYADCDIFVAPSLYESFGLVFVEAMMFAKPCVGARVGGVAEVVIEGETGLLVPPSDAVSLADALGDMIADPALRERMGMAGRARYLAEFTDDRMAQRLERIFSEALQKTEAEYADVGVEALAQAGSRE